MKPPVIDDAIYVGVYIGKGKEGREIYQMLESGARKYGLKMSPFLLQAGLKIAKSDRLQTQSDRLAKQSDRPRPNLSDSHNLPPSLRPTTSAARSARSKTIDIDAGPPVIEGIAPSSKPNSSDFE